MVLLLYVLCTGNMFLFYHALNNPDFRTLVKELFQI